MEIKIKELGYENTGGGCMVFYIDIERANGINRIGIDEEFINGYKTNADDADSEPDCVWSCSSFEELIDTVGKFNARKLMAFHYSYCNKYDCTSLISIKGRTQHWLDHHHSNETTDGAISFLKHLDASTMQVQDDVFSGKKLDEKYDFVVSMNGQACKMNNNADTYEAVRKLLVDYIVENG
jgi:hypothetical protein